MEVSVPRTEVISLSDVEAQEESKVIKKLESSNRCRCLLTLSRAFIRIHDGWCCQILQNLESPGRQTSGHGYGELPWSCTLRGEICQIMGATVPWLGSGAA